MPLISIITINYNNVLGLKETLDSVFAQTFKSFEYIVIDGNSTDGSVDLIQEYTKTSFDQFIWISEPDTGIYNAMNKGIRKASGKYLLFINSGDKLAANDVIERVIPYLNNDDDIVSGELEMIQNGKNFTKLIPPPKVNLNFCINEGLTHPNTFIKKDLFEKYGYYNEVNKIVSDWEFFLIACGLNSCNYKSIPVLVSVFNMDGISSKNSDLVKYETKIALERHLPLWKKLERLIRRK